MPISKLSSWITESFKNYTYSDTDTEWRRYIEDHRYHIISQSETKILSADDNELYRFRPREYLIDNRYDADLLWIVLYINQIYSPAYFYDIKELLIPNKDYVKSLRSKFDSFKANLNRSKI